MRTLSLSATVTVFLAALAHAEEMPPSAMAKDAPPGHLSSMSQSGIWEDADQRQRFERAAADYNLHIKLLTRSSGRYIKGVADDVAMYVKDENGKIIVEGEMTDGPLYVIQLNPGTYQIEAMHAGVTKTQKVTIDATGQKEIVFRWDD